MDEAQKITAGAGRAEPATSMRAIIRRYYALWLVYSFAQGFLFSVYPLFLRSRGLNQFEMNSVLATFFAVTFLTDVPTGAFADALGRRRAFIFGCVTRFCAFSLYFFAHHYLVFLMAEAIDGVGTTFCNGAIDAWGVDALDRAGFSGTKDRLFSRIIQVTNLGAVGSAVIGAYVANYNLAWPWVCSAAGFLMSALAAHLMMEESVSHTARIGLRQMPRRIAERVRSGFRYGFKSRTVVLLSIANGIFFAAWAPYWLEWPQYINDAYGVGVWIVGWCFALFTVARMAGAELMVRFGMQRVDRALRLSGLAIGSCVLLVAAGAAGNRVNLALALLVLFNLMTGAWQPLVQTWFNEQIEASERATLLSFTSTFATAGGSLGLLSVGAVADRVGLSGAWQMSGVISLAALPCYWLLRPRFMTPVATQAAES